jgi:hypothetical protein
MKYLESGTEACLTEGFRDFLRGRPRFLFQWDYLPLHHRHDAG